MQLNNKLICAQKFPKQGELLKCFNSQKTTLFCDVEHGKLLPLPSCRTPRSSRGIAGNVLRNTIAQERIC